MGRQPVQPRDGNSCSPPQFAHQRPPQPPTYLALAHLQLVVHHQNHLELLCRGRGSEASAAPPTPPHRPLLPLLAVVTVVLILPFMLRQGVLQ